jgi:acyl-CoA reductase-like NAD-dependent aldehyde dehydrogenase
MRIAGLVREHLEELALLETLDNGMPLSMSRSMVGRVAETLEYYSGWPTKIYGETYPAVPTTFAYTRREPLGVCAAITPWNSSLSSVVWKLAPALACGNAVIVKPAEQTPLSALRFGELILEADVPPGLVNILTGYGETAGAAISAHRGIDKVAFTGSTIVGKRILEASIGNLKRVTLELGGKSPNLVFADADLERAVTTAVDAFCVNTGQVCVAGTRVFVERRIADEFATELSRLASTRVIGDPLLPETQLGPLASAEQYERVGSYLELGLEEGASAMTGGRTIDGAGYFVEPTVFTGVDNDMRIAREEIFGPVAAVIPFDDEADAIRQANATTYGLAAGVWTENLGRAHRIGHALQVGTVWVNTYLELDATFPFGGYKESGLGAELGPQSVDAYTQSKTLMLRLPADG